MNIFSNGVSLALLYFSEISILIKGGMDMRVLRILIIVSLFFVTGQAIAQVACAGLTVIAEWKTNGNGQLRVSGTGVRDGEFVLVNAYIPNDIIDTRSGNNGRINFNVNGRNLNPVPCVVQVDQPGVSLCGQAVVANAPADCSPTGSVSRRPGNRPG
jgi:hypothetical protein